MRTFNFGLLAVLSCIAMIGATPIGNGAPAEALGRRQGSYPCVFPPPISIPPGCDPNYGSGDATEGGDA
ncbi:hypothetical protein DFH94DRAFT_698562 [Russula ochroleuca]|uniref:Uncharacterized protein n=1 Tax=Russula ochroleuca TaxID=152965 RepID=A0A9P5MNS0_9AGAM|nr:hypothetical protein DFH94DRAFT_698562 [Russula ochroleuca]